MTTSTWNVSTSGDWSDASDWSGGVPNSSTATATIAESGTYTVDIAASESFTAGSVTLNAANATLEIDGTLTLGSMLTLTAGTLDLTGTINGGTINTGTTAINSFGGTLNATTIDGPLTLGGSSSLTITGGLTMNGADGSGSGTLNDTGNDNTVYFSGTETINNAAINIGYDDSVAVSNGGVITLSSTTTTSEAGQYDNILFGRTVGSGSIINDGTIDATETGAMFFVELAGFTNGGTINAAGGSFQIQSNSFSNSGAIAVTSGDVLQVQATSFANTGTVSVDGTSTIQFVSSVATAELGTLDTASGATIDFSGSLNNEGAIYVMPAGVNVFGIIDGGTIEGPITAEGSSQSPDGLTLEGSPTLEGAGGTGAATINVIGSLLFSGTETIGNASINLGGTIANSGTGIVTFGPNVTIDYSGGFLGLTNIDQSPASGIVNEGTVDSTTSHAALTIDPVNFTNGGTVTVSNSGYVQIGLGPSTTSFDNTGTISVDGTSTLNFVSSVTTSELGTLDLASGALLEFGEGLFNSGGLNNSGATYSVPTGVLLAGAIEGGTLDGTIDAASSLQLSCCRF